MELVVQCRRCSKWRIIPTKEKYEEIRERIREVPFFCEHGREWKPELSCEVVTDIEHDETNLWIVDTPNVPMTPPGWERRLTFREITSPKLADVYYYPPGGRERLRSKADVRRYLDENPEYRDSISIEMFCFKSPKVFENSTPPSNQSAEVTEGGDIEDEHNESSGSSSDEDDPQWRGEEDDDEV